MSHKIDVVGVSEGDQRPRKPWRRASRWAADAAEAMVATGAGLPKSWGLLVGLAVNLFLIIAVIIGILSLIGVSSVTSGYHPIEFWTSWPVLTSMVLGSSLIIAFSVLAIINGIIIKPMRGIFAAVAELGRGNFDVRVRVGKDTHIREIEEFAADFNRAAEELSGVETMRTEFIDDFSHEFKTPIVSIQGFADLLRNDDLSNEERHEYAEIIYAESRRLATMASDILLLRQAESKAVLDEKETENVQVGEQVRLACALLQEKWAEKRLDFRVEVEDIETRGNAAFLDRAWVNLIDNACKFSPANGCVLVTLEQRETADDGCSAAVGPALSRDRTANTAFCLIFCVENHGDYVPPEVLERAFDRFYQADEARAMQGCGLGLPLVRRVAELHGGTVTATSAPSGRTSFTLTLPLA